MDPTYSAFISYAREDRAWAERLYMDLRKVEVNAWLDVRCLLPGTHWKSEIKKAIRSSRYFLLLLSKHSVTKRGYVQKELKEALDVLQEFPKGAIFLIPVKLDEIDPVDDELKELNWVDLVPDYHSGISRILSVITESRREPLTYAALPAAPSLPVRFIDKGREIVSELPLLIGTRAAISYAPFRSQKEYLQQFFDSLPSESKFADLTLSYYITIDTRYPSVLIGDDLKATYPEYVTIVLQNSFNSLETRVEGVSVRLSFGGIERMIGFGYDAIRQISVPEVGVTITLEALHRKEGIEKS